MRRVLLILIIGPVATLLILLLIETLGAQILTNFLIGHISDNAMLLIIVMGLFVFTMIISIIVGFYISGNIDIGLVLGSSFLSFFCTLFLLFIISNGSLLSSYPEVYQKISGFEVFLKFPEELVDFGIYILPNVFYLFILTIVIYYVLFILFLELL